MDDINEVPNPGSSVPPSTANLHLLQYAEPHRPWSRQTKWALILIAVAAITYFLWTWSGRSYWERYWVYHKQSAAVQHIPPEDWVAGTTVETPNQLRSGENPMEGVQFEHSWNVPKPWADFVNSSDIYFGPPLYVGEHRSRSGNVRIVVVTFSGSFRSGPRPDDTWLVPLVGQTVHPASPQNRPRITAVRLSAKGIYIPKNATLDVHAGRPDPADPSHFIIRLTSGQFSDIVDGWLQDDDTILFSPRSPMSGTTYIR